MIILGKVNSIYDLQGFQSAYKKPQRETVKIALIDDEPFPALDRLQRNDFKIKKFDDVSDVSSLYEYEIILVDIDGVAMSLSEKYQGAFLIKEIRKKYPHKVIIAYSSKTFDASYNDYFREADFVFLKDLSTEQWVENLDEAISRSVDPIYQWLKLRDYLLDNKVKLEFLIRIEDSFVKSIRDRNNTFPNSHLLKKLPQDIRAILQSFAGALLFALLFGA